MHGQSDQADMATLGRHVVSREGRVTVDRVELMCKVAIGIVLEFVTKTANLSRDLHRFVHAGGGPAPGTSIVEAKLEVGIPVG